MPKYREKPVVIEAIQWTGRNIKEISQFVGKNCKLSQPSGVLTISTLEGDMVANDGDYIIQGVQGEYYPCKPDIFEETYEVVKE